MSAEMDWLIDASQQKVLQYSIHSWSSYSAAFHPSNILVNDPCNQSSRWSSASGDDEQFVTLELAKPAIVTHITFGKYTKSHVCNLRSMKVYGGMDPSCPNLLLHHGLQNDSQPETLQLNFTCMAGQLPVKYIKIVPLAVWRSGFNYSIWYVELRGNDEPETVQPALASLSRFLDEQADRICLAHLRRRGHIEALQLLQRKSKVVLDGPPLDKLYSLIVEQGRFEEAEGVIMEAKESGLFEERLKELPLKAKWAFVEPLSPDGTRQRYLPCRRGGHQLVIDSELRKAFLFGGWTGSENLGDLWQLELDSLTWTCLSEDTSEQGGPGPCSCHKSCYDAERKQMYVMGKFVEMENRDAITLRQHLFRYDVHTDTWAVISEDTPSSGGPPSIYDHQMCIDPYKRLLFICGGKIQHPPGAPVRDGIKHSGLYVFDLEAGTWTLLMSDESVDPVSKVTFNSRLGHSMVIEPAATSLYIFAGQRNSEYMSDMLLYDYSARRFHQIFSDYTTQNGPEPGFTQRACIDSSRRRIGLLTGLIHSARREAPQPRNSLWLFDIPSRQWTCIDTINGDSSERKHLQPCPRYAHQFVYDSKKEAFYLFGGNPRDNHNSPRRLSDLWRLTLVRASTPDAEANRLVLSLRKLRFHELCRQNVSEALKYLRSNIRPLISSSDPEAERSYQLLAASAFQLAASASSKDEAEQMLHRWRIETFEQVSAVFPKRLRPPDVDLRSLVDISPS